MCFHHRFISEYILNISTLQIWRKSLSKSLVLPGVNLMGICHFLADQSTVIHQPMIHYHHLRNFWLANISLNTIPMFTNQNLMYTLKWKKNGPWVIFWFLLRIYCSLSKVVYYVVVLHSLGMNQFQHKLGSWGGFFSEGNFQHLKKKIC
jgi:hypothetical protein